MLITDLTLPLPLSHKLSAYEFSLFFTLFHLFHSFLHFFTLLNFFQSHRSVWENMQTVAEEKRKAYRCVCWSAKPITKEILKVRISVCDCIHFAAYLKQCRNGIFFLFFYYFFSFIFFFLLSVMFFIYFFYFYLFFLLLLLFFFLFLFFFFLFLFLSIHLPGYTMIRSDLVQEI